MMSENETECSPEYYTNLYDLNKVNSESVTFTVDDVVNKAGYGKFQIRLLFLSGLGWIADSCEVFVISILSQFLACEWTLKREHPAILTYAVFVGMAVGAVCLGTIGDIFGRKKALATSMVILFVVGFGNAFVPSFLWMVVCRGILGFGLGGVGQGLAVCTEYCPTHIRGRAAFFLCYFWSFGTILVILVSWVVMQYKNSWRLLLMILCLPSLLGLVSLKWYPESARYYLVSGQYDRAVKILQKVATTNGTSLPPGHLVQVITEEKRGRFLDLLTKKYRVATLILWYTWLAVALATYGTVFVSPIIIQKGFLGTDKNDNQTNGNESESAANVVPCLEFSQQNFIDLLWTSAAEFPGLVIFTFLAEQCGRKVLISVSCFVNGFLLLLLLIRTHKIVILLVLFAARGLMLAVFQLVYIVTLEVYPTTFRALGMGFGNFFSKMAGFIVPYVSQVLVFDHPTIAIGLMAGAMFLAAIATAFLPFETRGVQMKESAKEKTNCRIDLPQEK
ncbi:synaptic vesicle 2-related protein-like isoform X1 [Argiope bruennichi]|uniref:synaptic vesicle 2-related protein-like isoform X1 n=1 Tax=Argiope bruennichi TaxID=94029 RepID=UPI00249421E7|nr:synaptic vesicle 2-related protein-like isoform X1 [Argiope bruennichi]